MVRSSAPTRDSKISDYVRPDIPLVPFALKQDVETDQPADPEGAKPINAAIPASLRDFDFDESRLSQDALAQPLECDGIHGL